MIYLLDADWIISFLNGRSEAVEAVSQLADEGIVVSIITWGEIYEGLLAIPEPERRLAQFEEFTFNVDLIAPDIVVARHYAHTRAQLRSHGLLIPDNDLWIAATALAFDLTLVSRDDHFTRIPGLRLRTGRS